MNCDTLPGSAKARGDAANNRYRLAIDIGGTFTDAVMFDEKTGDIFRDKVLTTAHDPAQGFILCVTRLLEKTNIVGSQVAHVVHGTTIATNALLERRGARVGLIATEGFRDIVEIGRQIRHDMYDLQVEKPKPLVPRELCVSVLERLNSLGEVSIPLDLSSVLKAISTLQHQKVESIAICLLHSYRNPSHEKQVAEIIRRVLPHVAISQSSEIAPEIREYWRASTAIANAYISPRIVNYLDVLVSRLDDVKVHSSLHIMQSSGGLMSVDQAKERPILLLESGPAAGVISAGYFASYHNIENAIAFDMGGTSAKVSVVLGGKPTVVPEFEAGGVHGTGSGIAPASGYPILAPTIDLVEVGAGGGSIGWVDSGNLLRVGPHSSGSRPGPACYGNGGTEPTLTDANLALGRLNPEFFLGGELKLDLNAAQNSIKRFCADPLQMSVESAALGIVEVAKSRMAEAVRLVTVQRGHDPREFSLIATGGAGPAMANLLADELRLKSVVVPPSPGTASALGMLVSEIRHEFRTTRITPLRSHEVLGLHAVVDELEKRAKASLAANGVKNAEARLNRYMELRYCGQNWSIRIGCDDETENAFDVTTLRTKYEDRHRQLYGYFVRDEPIEIVNIGVLGFGVIPRPSLRSPKRSSRSHDQGIKGMRNVIFENGYVSNCKVFDRGALGVGAAIDGPAIIEEIDSTTIILPGYHGEVLELGSIIIRPRIS